MKINGWVDVYIDDCMQNGRKVSLLTQWCISKNLEKRLEVQGGIFVPTKKERLLFESEIPEIAEVFFRNGFQLDWWITFNRSYLNSRRVKPELEMQYKELIAKLAGPSVKGGWLNLADWEDDFLGTRSQPNREVLMSIENFVKPEALELEMRWNAEWAAQETSLVQNQEELRSDVIFQLACEAQEGRILSENGAPFGEFLLIPLEVPEQYDSFTIFAKDFKKRIVAILRPYPWRLKENN